jgi:hypothetical protein
MAKTKVKGTVLEIGSGTNYTAVAQVTNFAVTGGQTENVETRTLDGPVGIEYSPTGYTETGSVTFSLIHDLALAGHQALTDILVSGHLATTGAALEIPWRIKAADTSTSTISFNSVALGLDLTGDAADVLRSDVTLKVSGNVTWPT